MNDRSDSELSAFVDNELTSSEAQHVIDALEADTALRARWARYQLVSQLLRRELPGDVRHDLAAKVSGAMAAEPTLLAPHRLARTRRVIVRHAASLAVAASLTAVAVLGIQRLTDEATPPAAQVAATSEQPAQGDWVRVSGPRWNLAHPEIESKLNTYFVNHSGYASEGRIRGMLPYAKIAGYESGRASGE